MRPGRAIQGDWNGSGAAFGGDGSAGAGDPPLRQRILSIGIPILLPDGTRLLRGPAIKSGTAYDGWVDLSPKNMERWQGRLAAIQRETGTDNWDNSSRNEHLRAVADFEPGDLAAWILLHEDGGVRQKS